MDNYRELINIFCEDLGSRGLIFPVNADEKNLFFDICYIAYKYDEEIDSDHFYEPLCDIFTNNSDAELMDFSDELQTRANLIKSAFEYKLR